MSLKLDLHVHSISQGKEFLNAQTLATAIARAGLDGVAITNFHDISHALALKKAIPGYAIIVGQEVLTSDGHLLGLGLSEKVPDFLSARETVMAIHRQGGLAIAAHPYLFLGVGKVMNSLEIDAIEGYNALAGRYLIFNYLARKAAKKRKLPQVAATDTTDARFIGRSFTEVFTSNPSDILDKIRNGNISTFNRPLPVPAVFILKNLANFRDLETCRLHATPCVLCGRSIAVRLFRKRLKCIDCGQENVHRIVCSSGHYFCKKCAAKRIEQKISKGTLANG